MAHKKLRRKRGIPVAPPRLPSFDNANPLTPNQFSQNASSNIQQPQLAEAADQQQGSLSLSVLVVCRSKLIAFSLSLLSACPQKRKTLMRNQCRMKAI